jgi:hypothetical protein
MRAPVKQEGEKLSRGGFIFLMQLKARAEIISLWYETEERKRKVLLDE